MKKIVLSLTAVAALSGFAMAGGDIVPVAPAPADSWSGFYVGLQTGGVWGDADVDFSDGTTVYPTHGLNVDGWSGGIYGGYNWLLDNNWLVGIEGEWNLINADDAGTLVGAPPGYTTKVEQDWDASLRLRVGYVMDDTWMPYITGGVAWGRVNVKLNDPTGVNVYNHDETLTGWTVGVGIEMKITENLHGRIQYRYTDYGDPLNAIAVAATPLLSENIDYNAHMLTVGISYRF